MEFREKIRAFIDQNLVVLDDEERFSDSDNIFVLGYVNSLFAMKLLNFVEAEFNIAVENEEMGLENFSSVDNIIKYVERKKNPLKQNSTGDMPLAS